MQTSNIKMTNQFPKIFRAFWILICVFDFWFLIFGFFNAFADEGRLNQANMFYLKDDYANCLVECQNILKYSPPLALKRQTLYLMGLSYLKLNDTIPAQEAFQEALNQNPLPPLEEKIELAIGETYFLNGETEKAQIQFKQILAAYPKTSFTPTLYFHLGHCALKLGMWDEAKGYFNKVAQKYPLSLEAPLAQDILKNGEFYFTIQIGSFINQKNADELCQNLRDKGYDGYLTDFNSGATIYHRVRVGKYNLRSEAQDQETKLKADGFPTHLWP